MSPLPKVPKVPITASPKTNLVVQAVSCQREPVMDARTTRGWALALGLGLLVFGLMPTVARADEATARLHDGGMVTGTIEVYEPGRRIVLRTASGEVITLVPAQIAALEITPTPGQGAADPGLPPPSASELAPPSPTTTPYTTDYQLVPAAPPPQQAYAPAAQPYALVQPRQRLPSLAAPAVLMVLGASLITGGLWILTHMDDSWDDDDSSAGRRRSAFGLLSVGAPLTFVGLVVLLPIQTGKRARRRALYARQLSLSPALDLAGGRYGMAGTLRF